MQIFVIYNKLLCEIFFFFFSILCNASCKQGAAFVLSFFPFFFVVVVFVVVVVVVVFVAKPKITFMRQEKRDKNMIKCRFWSQLLISPCFL